MCRPCYRPRHGASPARSPAGHRLVTESTSQRDCAVTRRQQTGERPADPDVRLALHLGDIKSGSSLCTDDYFAMVRGQFDRFAQHRRQGVGVLGEHGDHRLQVGQPAGRGPVARQQPPRAAQPGAAHVDVAAQQPGLGQVDGFHRRGVRIGAGQAGVDQFGDADRLAVVAEAPGGGGHRILVVDGQRADGPGPAERGVCGLPVAEAIGVARLDDQIGVGLGSRGEQVSTVSPEPLRQRGDHQAKV